MVDVAAAADVVAMVDVFPAQVVWVPGAHMALNIPACSADDDPACNICDVLCLAFYKSYVDAADDVGAPGHKNP
jgi:hypothetical protein